MFTEKFERLEAQLYREVNQVVEPLARVGFGSPTLWRPIGVIVIETAGRKTGRILNIPLLATRLADYWLVSTVRRKSQWIRNLAAHPEVHYWKDGRRYEATAVVFAPDLATSQSDQLPPNLACIVSALRPYSRVYGGGVALLISRQSHGVKRNSL